MADECSDVVTRAKAFAAHAHKDHFRKDGARTPYVNHLAEVAELVGAAGGGEVEIAAAWLHDTVEDTSTTIEDIRREFGDDVASIVDGVTDRPEWLALSMQERKQRQAERVAKAADSIKRVKLADQSSNVAIVAVGREFSMDTNLIYIESARRIAEVCKGVSPFLDDLFGERYRAAFQTLKALEARAADLSGGDR